VTGVFEEESATKLPAPAHHIVAAAGDLAAVQAYCGSRASEDLSEVVATLREICLDGNVHPATRAILYGDLVRYKETLERRRRGLSATNATSIEDWRFRFVTDELRAWQKLARMWFEQKPTSIGAQFLMAQSLLSAGSIDAAETCFERLRAANCDVPWIMVTRFDDAFHEGLEDRAVGFVKEAREVARLKDAPGASKYLFTGCDIGYLRRYGAALIASCARHRARGIGFHLHLFDATDEEAADVNAQLEKAGLDFVSIATEWSGLRDPAQAATTPEMRAYYHAVRFFRYWQFAEAHPEASCWFLDCDLLFNQSPQLLFDHLAGKEMALWLLPCRSDAHLLVNACMFGISPSTRARRYLRRTAGYIAEYVSTGLVPWGLDQTAMFAVLKVLLSRDDAPTLALIPPELSDGGYGENTVVWQGKCFATNSELGRYQDLLASLVSTLSL